jgi:hypothetical protein
VNVRRCLGVGVGLLGPGDGKLELVVAQALYANLISTFMVRDLQLFSDID